MLSVITILFVQSSIVKYNIFCGLSFTEGKYIVSVINSSAIIYYISNYHSESFH